MSLFCVPICLDKCWHQCSSKHMGTKWDVMERDKVCKLKGNKAQCCFLLLTISSSPFSLPFTVQKPPPPPPPFLSRLDPLWTELMQSDRIAEPVGVCVPVCVCVCTSLEMCECETWHITEIWVTPSLLPLSVSCMQLICFDRWPSPALTADMKGGIKMVKLLKSAAGAVAGVSGCILWFWLCLLLWTAPAAYPYDRRAQK